ncbi:MAG: altronate dehydratase [Anaerolineae bacterium]|nr:altronate dehydratase [Anaerolineae bacterium]
MDALLMHLDDDVALAAKNLAAGQMVYVDGRAVTLRQPIPFGHKFAIRSIPRGQPVLKYGQPIGRAVADIAIGQHAHVHNVESLRGRGDWEAGSEAPVVMVANNHAHHLQSADVGEPPTTTFLGYRRQDGRAGVRNHVLVLATVHCAKTVVDRIGQMLPEVVALSHVYGCSQLGDDLAQSQRVLEEFARHPNVGAVLLIGLGCESMPTIEMGEKLAALGVVSQRLTIQEEGGSRKTYELGLGIARELLQEVSRAKREPIPLSELIVATECGGSDAWSGVTANPAVGAASDLIVKAGGTVILSEVPEFIGAEHLLAARGANAEVARQIVAATLEWEEKAKQMGVDMRGAQPTPGNIEGGLTTIEEKSLGTIAKGGTSPVQEYVGYARRLSKRGLVIMDTPGNDLESVTGMIAGGAQVVVFTTGRGSPTGSPIAPVIKVATNSAMYRRLQDDMDIDAGTVLEEGESLASVGHRIFEEIVAAANGKTTAAEAWGHREFAINMIGPRV